VARTQAPQRVRLVVASRTADRDDVWIVSDGERSREPFRVPFFFKKAAIASAIWIAHRIAEAGGRAQVVVHTRDGRIQWERTYPRSSDPRRSRG
jgi:hypothetical protein